MCLRIPMLGKNKFVVVRLTFAIKRSALLVLYRLLLVGEMVITDCYRMPLHPVTGYRIIHFPCVR